MHDRSEACDAQTRGGHCMRYTYQLEAVVRKQVGGWQVRETLCSIGSLESCNALCKPVLPPEVPVPPCKFTLDRMHAHSPRKPMAHSARRVKGDGAEVETHMSSVTGETIPGSRKMTDSLKRRELFVVCILERLSPQQRPRRSLAGSHATHPPPRVPYATRARPVDLEPDPVPCPAPTLTLWVMA